MYDLNFVLQSEKDTKKLRIGLQKFFLWGMAITIAFTLGISTLYRAYQIVKVNHNITKTIEKIQSKQVQKDLERVREKEQQVIFLETQMEKIEKIMAFQKADDPNALAVFYKIIELGPEGLYFDSFQVDQQSIQIQGYSDDKEKIAFFKKFLGQYSIITEIDLPQITRTDDTYHFIMSMKYKGGEHHEVE